MPKNERSLNERFHDSHEGYHRDCYLWMCSEAWSGGRSRADAMAEIESMTRQDVLEIGGRLRARAGMTPPDLMNVLPDEETAAAMKTIPRKK